MGIALLSLTLGIALLSLFYVDIIPGILAVFNNLKSYLEIAHGRLRWCTRLFAKEQFTILLGLRPNEANLARVVTY